MKLWHDDVRPPPDGWTWAKTNAEAQRLLSEHDVTEASLDHDLGETPDPNDPDVLMRAGSSPDGSGYDLVRWMIEHDRIPPLITIHSWNPVGAERMAYALADAGFPVAVVPYRHPLLGQPRFA